MRGGGRRASGKREREREPTFISSQTHEAAQGAAARLPAPDDGSLSTRLAGPPPLRDGGEKVENDVDAEERVDDVVNHRELHKLRRREADDEGHLEGVKDDEEEEGDVPGAAEAAVGVQVEPAERDFQYGTRYAGAQAKPSQAEQRRAQ